MSIQDIRIMSEDAKSSTNPSSIKGNLDRILAELAKQDEVINMLTSKLTEVLRETVPEPTSDPSSKLVTNSELGDKLSNIYYRLNDLNYRLARVVDRIDL